MKTTTGTRTKRAAVAAFMAATMIIAPVQVEAGFWSSAAHIVGKAAKKVVAPANIALGVVVGVARAYGDDRSVGEMIAEGAKEGVVRVIDTVSETIDDAKTVGKFGVEVAQDVYQATQD